MPRVGYWLDGADLSAGGTGTYAWRILETIVGGLTAPWELVILCRSDREDACHALVRAQGSRACVCAIPQRFSLATRALGRLGGLLGVSQSQPGIFDPWYRWLRELEVDLLHTPYSYMPPGENACPLLFTMHDVQEIHYPEFFSPRERAQRAERSWKSLEVCAGVVVSFPHVKADLLKYFAVPEEKVHVCPLPFRNVQLRAPSTAEEATLRTRHADAGEFLLYPAQTWPHKNHLTLIRAVELLRERGRNVNLLCTGRKNPRFFPAIEAYLLTSPVADQVRFLDLVPEEELCWLYRHCAVVVLPTLYEAGSFPLLEAMSLETPVICSAVTSLPETMGDERFLFDPLDVPGLAELIGKSLDDSAFRQANLDNGRQRIRQLREMDTLPTLVDAWQKALDSPLATYPVAA